MMKGENCPSKVRPTCANYRPSRADCLGCSLLSSLTARIFWTTHITRRPTCAERSPNKLYSEALSNSWWKAKQDFLLFENPQNKLSNKGCFIVVRKKLRKLCVFWLVEIFLSFGASRAARYVCCAESALVSSLLFTVLSWKGRIHPSKEKGWFLLLVSE